MTVRRVGIEFVYKLEEGEDSRVLPDGRLLVTHPDRKPKIINRDGTETVLEAA